MKDFFVSVLFVVCWVGALGSAFSCLASIIHFQILWALGYFFLALVLFFMPTVFD